MVVVVVLVGVVGVGADRVRRQCSRRNEADCLYHGLSPSITQRCFQEHKKTEVVTSQSGSQASFSSSNFLFSFDYEDILGYQPPDPIYYDVRYDLPEYIIRSASQQPGPLSLVKECRGSHLRYVSSFMP